MAAVPQLAIGRFLLSIEDQPGSCGIGCPCTTDPSNGPEDAARWTPDTTQENTP